MEKADVKFLCKVHGVQPMTVGRLLKAGVSDDDVYEVLEMRGVLSDQNDRGEVCAIVSVGVMAEAYRVAGGDMDVLERMVERADEGATEICSRWSRRTGRRVNDLRARYSRAMEEVMEKVGKYGPMWLDEGDSWRDLNPEGDEGADWWELVSGEPIELGPGEVLGW
jgi:hypothetical protein